MYDVTDFFEEDEPLEKIKLAWVRGEKGRTAPPPSFTLTNMTFVEGPDSAVPVPSSMPAIEDSHVTVGIAVR